MSSSSPTVFISASSRPMSTRTVWDSERSDSLSERERGTPDSSDSVIVRTGGADVSEREGAGSSRSASTSCVGSWLSGSTARRAGAFSVRLPDPASLAEGVSEAAFEIFFRLALFFGVATAGTAAAGAAPPGRTFSAKSCAGVPFSFDSSSSADTLAPKMRSNAMPVAPPGSDEGSVLTTSPSGLRRVLSSASPVSKSDRSNAARTR